MSGFFFGPIDSMEPIEVSAGASIEFARGSSELVTSGGVRYMQSGRRAPRTWTVGRIWQEPAWARTLTASAQGLLGECWLYDVAAARENMVPANLSVGTGPRVMTDGLPLQTLTAGHSVTVPVLAGRMYTISAWASADPGEIVFSYRQDAGELVSVPLTPGSGHRQASSSFMAPTSGLLTVTILVGNATGLRVRDGAPDGRYYSGHGTPCKVAVRDPGRALQMLTTSTFSDYEVTLLEVGTPGFM